MGGIFINFRKQDEPGFAALLQRELSRSFGAAAVFYASKAIRPGDDFQLGLLGGVRRSEVLIAVIGPRWLTTPHPTGGRALDHKTDWVRREIAEAFARGIRVIPILINDTERLTDATLPDDISQLTKCQYLRLRHDDLEYDLVRITTTLSEVTNASAGRQYVRHHPLVRGREEHPYRDGGLPASPTSIGMRRPCCDHSVGCTHYTGSGRPPET